MRILLTANASYVPPRGGATRSNLIWLDQMAGAGHACRIVCGASGEGAELRFHSSIAVFAVEDPSRAARAAAILTLVGAINLPIIKFSVDWWNTLHQPASVIRMGGPALDRAFLVPLLVMAVAFSLLFVTLHLAAMRNEILRRRVRSLQLMQAAQAGQRSA